MSPPASEDDPENCIHDTEATDESLEETDQIDIAQGLHRYPEQERGPTDCYSPEDSHRAQPPQKTGGKK